MNLVKEYEKNETEKLQLAHLKINFCGSVKNAN
jgi:hypothetical protein